MEVAEAAEDAEVALGPLDHVDVLEDAQIQHVPLLVSLHADHGHLRFCLVLQDQLVDQRQLFREVHADELRLRLLELLAGGPAEEEDAAIETGLHAADAVFCGEQRLLWFLRICASGLLTDFFSLGL